MRKSFPHIDPAVTDQNLGIKAAESLLSSCTSRQVRYQQPAPHGVVDDCFDPASLAAIHEYFPAPGMMKPYPGQKEDYKYRLIAPLSAISLGESHTALFRQPAAEFWETFQQHLNNPAFSNQLLDAINPGNSAKKKDRHPSLHLKTVLIRDSDGYSTGPHIDPQSRVFTILAYLPERQRLHACGTRLYVPKNPQDQDQFLKNGQDQGWTNFFEVKAIDFVSNRALVLPRTAEAWHGVTPVKGSQGQRKMILIAGIDKNLVDRNQ